MLTELTTNDPSLFRKDRFAFQTDMMKELEKKISLTEVETETKRLLEETTTYTSKMENEIRAILQSSTELPKANQQESSRLEKNRNEEPKSTVDPVTPLSLLDSILGFSNSTTSSNERAKKKKSENLGSISRQNSLQKTPSGSMDSVRNGNSSPNKTEPFKDSASHGYSPPRPRRQSKDSGLQRSTISGATEDHTFGENDKIAVKRPSSSHKDGEHKDSDDKADRDKDRKPRFGIDQRVAAFVPDDGDLREKCYVVIIRKYDPTTDKYIVRDPEAIAGEKDTWKISENKIYDYKRNKKIVERGENPFSVGDRVYSLYKDRETDETSTEFYEAVIDKIGKHTVLVKFLDDSGDTSRLCYDELFKRDTSTYGELRKGCSLPKIKLKIKKETVNSSRVTRKSSNWSSDENEREGSKLEIVQESSIKKQKRRRLVALLDDDDENEDYKNK
ncbi:hypothetical protein K7432_004533 [Basidiobolus ranarum]